MPPKRGKWQSPRGRGQHRGRARSSWSSPRSTTPSMSGPWSSYGQTHSSVFSMMDEARSTVAHHQWTTEKLRLKPVAFVSAGMVNPLEEITGKELPRSGPPTEPAEDAPAPVPTENASRPTDTELSVIETKAADEPETATEEAMVTEQTEATTGEAIVTGRTETTAEALVLDDFTDGPGDPTQRHGDQDQPTKSSELSLDDLFIIDNAGDESVEVPDLPPPKVPSLRPSPENSDSSDDEVIIFKGRANKVAALNLTSTHSNLTVFAREDLRKPSDDGEAFQDSDRSHGKAATLSQPQGRSKPQTRRSRVANKKASEEEEEKEKEKEEEEEEEEDAILADYIANMAENSDDDFLQSLATLRDLGGDHHAVNFGSDNEISPFNQDEALGGDELAESDSSEASSDAEDVEDEDMDIEMITSLTTRREALEINDNDFVSFTTSFAKAKMKKSIRERPSASNVADELDSLNLGDWDHMAAQARKRKSKQPPNFNVSDPEIEAALRQAWQNDRERKKTRKLEREALRAEGLLDKNASPDDLSVKYRSGMKLDDIKAELCSFLLSEDDRLEFPPLDKHARKILHELAGKFDLKSKSIGKGDQRRPVLHRTNRTIRFSELQHKEAVVRVDKAAMRIYRKYFHRTDVRGQGNQETKMATGTKTSYKALTPREGEIVGASVPEIGEQNKGRAMLEKMGWTKGMALGADNKGILVPVAQVVKRSKAGLG
ncbi:hypothetical protein VTJ83DRAFT_3015 [Remersonia thermophila]|uniref:Protein SQS1 n=1 Tax=Remersonia thermophila TaxID=72144 RepID=A0ABR4DF30_9PEZI